MYRRDVFLHSEEKFGTIKKGRTAVPVIPDVAVQVLFLIQNNPGGQLSKNAL